MIEDPELGVVWVVAGSGAEDGGSTSWIGRTPWRGCVDRSSWFLNTDSPQEWGDSLQLCLVWGLKVLDFRGLNP